MGCACLQVRDNPAALKTLTSWKDSYFFNLNSMANKNTVTIDLTVWTSQAQYAVESNHSQQYVNKLIRRGQLESWPIPELRVVLVKRPQKTT